MFHIRLVAVVFIFLAGLVCYIANPRDGWLFWAVYLSSILIIAALSYRVERHLQRLFQQHITQKQ
jgi:uncharacterized membrane protein